VEDGEQLALGGTPRRRARKATELAGERPVARVAVDTGVAHLDRPFDYAVPASMDAAEPGCRVRVRFSGRLVDGFVLERCERSDHEGKLSPLVALVSPERVLTPEIASLARVLADRFVGSLYDVLRLVVPPRHARVEAEPPGDAPQAVTAPGVGSWDRYGTGPSYLGALGSGAPRAVWAALPGPTWPGEVATAVRTTVSGGRGAVVVLPDARDVERVATALGDVPHVVLRADLGPAERYRRWLRVLRGEVLVAVGTRAAAFAPVKDLGLVVLWDDGDDLHAEPRAPYCHTRDVLVQRAHLAGAAALVGGFARTAEGQLLVESGWAAELVASREQVRRVAPRVDGTSEDDLARDPVAQAARIPGLASEAARAALAADAPVLVQVPRRGYVPALACQRDRTPARCPRCQGPLHVTSGHAVPSCLWCGRLAGDWTCPTCEGRQLRAVAVGSRRPAEELGRAFPGVPVRTSGRDEVLAGVGAGRALVVATPGAEPVAEGGYGAVLLLDAWALLTRPDLRAGEEALRRWLAAAALARPAAEGGRVVVVADRGLVPVQALVRWDPAGAAARELRERRELAFPPASRMVALSGSARAVADLVEAVVDVVGASTGGAEVLGPVADGEGERVLLRVAREQSASLTTALRTVLATRSAHKAETVRVQVDPPSLG
jgi:primosomal protein N' (replication factor Y)